jgi:long-chain acyl-CoA synthetase
MANKVVVTDQDFALQRFYRWEKERADAVFMTQPMGGEAVRTFTWKQSGDEARRMATWLIAQNYPAGSKIAILGKNSAHWILADLAIWMAGHVSVPIYPTFNGDALRYILEHSESVACFVGKLDEVSALKDGVPANCPLITLPLSPAIKNAAASWDELIAKAKPLATQTMRGGQELATIIYTSGTTGNPKGVMHNFHAMAWALASVSHRVTFTVDTRMLSYLPLAHVAERMMVEQGGFRNGCQIFFAESLDTFVKDMNRCRPTLFFSVPRLWVKFQQGVHAKMPPAKLQRLLKIPILRGIVKKKLLTGLGLDKCTLAIGGAAPMPADLLRWYRDLGLDLIEGYGMTENCATSHGTLPGTYRPGTVGMPYQDIESRIDPQTGYYKDPEQTAATMTADGWLRTGDKGLIEKDGALRITGRVKDIFKTSKGKYVAPAPIEDLLVIHPDVEACAVTGANFAQPFAIVMLSPDAVKRVADKGERAELMTSLAAHLKDVNTKLEAHETLDFLAVISTTWTPENGLVTPTFKVKRPKIEDAYADHYEGWLKQKKVVVWSDA